MKFALNPYNRNTQNEDLLNDIKRVVRDLKLNTLGQKDYKKYGRYSCSTITRRFGSWVKALSLAGLEAENYHFISDEDLLTDLKRIAHNLDRKALTQVEYKTYGKYSIDPFIDHFGSWFSALQKADLEKTHNIFITNEELFENLEEVWIKLGRQPKYDEMAKPLSRYSKDVYARRFGSWRKALEVFVEQVNDEDNDLEADGEQKVAEENNKAQPSQHKTGRNINWRLRFLVMRQDNFKCKNCGRSPATDSKIILHVDHIKAWANGGETILENLQTLCSVCNIGKSDLE